MEATKWATATGSIQCAGLSLRRIGWEWTRPFEFTTDQGDVVELCKHSPNMVGHLLQQAVQRWHQRRWQAKLRERIPAGLECYHDYSSK
eukprot:6712973-Karenia_brevis.AAC.1